MTETETYNGWTNRETWAFWLHVTNDEGWYNSVREFVRERLTECEGCEGTGKTEPVVAGVVDEDGEVDCEGCGGTGEVFEDDDYTIGESVVEYVKDALDEFLSLDYQAATNLEINNMNTEAHDSFRMMHDEVGSWWRIDYAEIGAAARELVSE